MTQHPVDEPAKPATHKWPLWLEVIVLCVVALLVAVVVKTFFVQSFYVPSASMEPTLMGHKGAEDRILVQKVSYWSGDVDRGDVVVFKDPGGWLRASPEPNDFQRTLELIGLYPSDGHLVKRVVAVGGDRVECCDDEGRLTVNGVAVDEEYVQQPDRTGERPFTVTVPDGHLWVMGDNRGNSEDSRAHQDEAGQGFVSTDLVVGKVWGIVWPLGRIGGLDDAGQIATLDVGGGE